MLLRPPLSVFFFFNDTATTEIYTLSLHDALPIWTPSRRSTPPASRCRSPSTTTWSRARRRSPARSARQVVGSEEHTSELQSPDHLVCRLLLEKKKKKIVKRRTVGYTSSCATRSTV